MRGERYVEVGGTVGLGEAPEGALSDAEVVRLEDVLESAMLLGPEDFEPNCQVLVLSLETQPGRSPRESADGRRIELPASLVSTTLVAFSWEDADRARQLRTFEQEQLADVTTVLDEPRLTGQLVGGGEPRRGRGPVF